MPATAPPVAEASSPSLEERHAQQLTMPHRNDQVLSFSPSPVREVHRKCGWDRFPHDASRQNTDAPNIGCLLRLGGD
jgi:hypothetical protein